MANVRVIQQEFSGDDGFQSHEIPFVVRFLRVAFAPQDFGVYDGYGKTEPIRHIRAGERVELGLSSPSTTIGFGWPLGAALPGAYYAKATIIVSDEPMYSSGAAEQSIGLAVYDSLGNLRAWEPWSSNDSIVERHAAIVHVENSITLATNPLPVAQEQLATFDVLPRRTTRDYSQTVTFAAAGRAVLNSLWLAIGGAAVRTRLLTLDVALMDASAACEVWLDLIRLNSEPTGGTLYTPVPRYTGQAAASTVVRKQPSGGAAETGDALSSVVYKLGATGAVSTVNPAPPIVWQPLHKPASAYERNPAILPGEGFALTVDCNAAATVRVVSRLSLIEEY